MYINIIHHIICTTVVDMIGIYLIIYTYYLCHIIVCDLFYNSIVSNNPGNFHPCALVIRSTFAQLWAPMSSALNDTRAPDMYISVPEFNQKIINCSWTLFSFFDASTTWAHQDNRRTTSNKNCLALLEEHTTKKKNYWFYLA